MTTTNDITGDKIRSRAPSDKFRENFDSIFGRKYKATYTKDGKFKHVTISAANLTEVIHEAERAGWVSKGWQFIGVERG